MPSMRHGHSMKELRTIILAAGKGTRMKSETPKVLHTVCGKPIIYYVLDIAKATSSLKTYVVLGHKSEKVKNALMDSVITVDQPKMLGTADAVKTARRALEEFPGQVLILCGDTPLLRAETIGKVRAELAARAALEGKSMQEYLRGELERLAARPSRQDWLRNVRDRKRAAGMRVPPELILEQRDADRR